MQPLEVLKLLKIKPRMRIADFGCGSGHIALAAAQLVGEHGVVYAVDIQDSLVRALAHEVQSRSFHNIYPVCADATILGGTKIPDSIIDITILMNNQVNAGVQSALLQEAARVTKKIGEIIVIDWLTGSTVPLAPAIDACVSQEHSVKNAARAGLALVDEFRPDRYHYGLRFHKL